MLYPAQDSPNPPQCKPLPWVAENSRRPNADSFVFPVYQRLYALGMSDAFSKKLDNHKAACALHFAYYNFCRVHQTLRETPAMEAGIANRIWTLRELLSTQL